MSENGASRLAATFTLAAVFALLLLLVPLCFAEITQKQDVRVSVEGKITPKALPRSGSAPIAVSISGRIASSLPGGPPQLKTLTIAINHNGRLDARGLPRCRLRHIQPSTSADALASCRSSLVGEGSFSANVQLPQQSPFPSNGRVLAFNGKLGGRPAILAHIYGTKPVPTSYVLPFLIRSAHGTYGTILEASLPQVTGSWGFVTGIAITLDRTFTFRGRKHSYFSSGCPAARGFPGATFPLARTTFAFDGGLNLTSTLTRSCTVRG
jgi:hypothetical protein